MSIFKSDIELADVFNPRGEYNPEMYVARPKYEAQFELALDSDMCILVHGQSGTGKTWLTRKSLETSDYYYKVINLAHASNANSIYPCFKNMMNREKWVIRTKYSEKKASTIGIPGTANGTLEHTDEYTSEVDYFMEFLKFMSYRTRDKKKRRYIVFENFESILESPQLIKELSNLITLIDDEEVIAYKTKFIIIGATKDIHTYFKSLPNINTIENRIFELPEVSTLTVNQAYELINRGFNRLKIDFQDISQKEMFIKEITKTTGGIPQRLQELCLTISKICLKNISKVKNEWLEEAKRNWVMSSLNKNYAYISKLLTYDSEANSHRNQVLYCIAQRDTMVFTNKQIDEDMLEEFPISTVNKKLSSTRQLNALCKVIPPLLEKIDDSNEYSFVDFKCALCLRTILHKDGESVEKNDIYEI